MVMTSEEVLEGLPSKRLSVLARWNVGLAVLHAAQAVAVLWLSTGFSITLTSAYPAGPPGTDVPAPEPFVDVRVGMAVAVFLGLAALDHLLTGTVLRRRYERGLRAGVNRFRWVEYAFSATVMILLIGAYAGVVGVTAMIGIAGANVGMILFGWLQETGNPPDRTVTTMLPFWFGCIAGAAPWLAITVNILGSESVPGFVYGIFGSLFVFFVSFAVNQWLQYRRVGPWSAYAFGEQVYLALSLLAKSALAWQIFAGSLAA